LYTFTILLSNGKSLWLQYLIALPTTYSIRTLFQYGSNIWTDITLLKFRPSEPAGDNNITLIYEPSIFLTLLKLVKLFLRMLSFIEPLNSTYLYLDTILSLKDVKFK
jgi:hypothetical protein